MIPKGNNFGLILAKSNSLGLPGKNLLEINGKSLLSICIEQMLQENIFSKVFVSSDSSQMLKEALESGAVPIARDLSLTSNDAYIEAVCHAVNAMPGEFDTVTISQVVQPAKSPGIFRRILSKHDKNIDSVVTVRAFEASPTWLFQSQVATQKLSQIEEINYGKAISRRDDIVEIDNKVVSFTNFSFQRSKSITPWPYLGCQIKYVKDRVVNANLTIDINSEEDWDWLNLLKKKGIWDV